MAYNLATTYGSLADDDFDDFLQGPALTFRRRSQCVPRLRASTSCSKNLLLLD